MTAWHRAAVDCRTHPFRAWADPAKTLKAVFEVDVTGFDPAGPGSDAATKAIGARMKGKRLPQIGNVEVSIVEEANPRLLMFSRGELDLVDIPRDLAPRVMDPNGRLLPDYAARGVDLQRATELAVTYTFFNMEDPVIGGYTSERRARLVGQARVCGP